MRLLIYVLLLICIFCLVDSDLLQFGDEGGMALIGQIGEFNVDNEAVTAYLERLGLFLAENLVEDERKVAVFISVIWY